MEQGRELGGRYRLDVLLGRGGMGEVWEAKDFRLDRRVAVKVVLAPLDSNPRVVTRLMREARAAASLQHSGICVVHDVGEHEGTPFFVMERLRGTDLNTMLEQGPISVGRVAEVGAEIADALAHAHARQVVHRDIKPANILLLEDGHAKICDFGIARLADGTPLTREGARLGTPAFMAPEQWRGEPVDGRTDLYSLGCTLYLMLTGRPPFVGNQHTLMYRHLDGTPDSPRTYQPHIPPALESLVLEMLAKDPRQRPVDATEVARRLRDLARPPVEAPVRREDIPAERQPSASPAPVDTEPPETASTGRHIPRRAMLVAGLAVVGIPTGAYIWSKDNSATRRTPGAGASWPNSGGTIKVGFMDAPPHSFQDEDGRLTGIGPEVTREILNALGADRLEPVREKAFDDLIPGLNNKRFDMLAVPLEILADRCAEVSFTSPALALTTAFMIRQGNPANITSFADLAPGSGRTVAVVNNTPEEESVSNNPEGVKKFSNIRDAVRALMVGQVDAVAHDAAILNWHKKKDFADSSIEVSRPFLAMGADGRQKHSASGYAFRKADADLLAAFDAELKKIKSSGRLLEIAKPFGVTQLEVDTAKLGTTESLCKH